MKRLFIIVTCIIMSFSASGQLKLKPSITSPAQPADMTPIDYEGMMKYVPIKDFSFEDSGPAVGDTIPDFTLYTLNDIPVNMRNELLKKKPVLLISGSYTCPEFRKKIDLINQIDSLYGGAVSVFIIYTTEAHPTDKNPYWGRIWYKDRLWFHGNIPEGILFKQPRTYGERKAKVREMTKNMYIRPELIIDGHLNEWWHYFGPAPNNAYLINTDGAIVSKHAWLDKGSRDMKKDIHKLLHKNSPYKAPVRDLFTDP